MLFKNPIYLNLEKSWFWWTFKALIMRSVHHSSWSMMMDKEFILRHQPLPHRPILHHYPLLCPNPYQWLESFSMAKDWYTNRPFPPSTNLALLLWQMCMESVRKCISEKCPAAVELEFLNKLKSEVSNSCIIHKILSKSLSNHIFIFSTEFYDR